MTTDVIKSAPKRGERTKNGAVILDVKRAFGENPSWIVLCLWADESPLHPYVTWWAYWSESGELACSMGHYHDQLSQAIVDFDSRS